MQIREFLLDSRSDHTGTWNPWHTWAVVNREGRDKLTVIGRNSRAVRLKPGEDAWTHSPSRDGSMKRGRVRDEENLT